MKELVEIETVHPNARKIKWLLREKKQVKVKRKGNGHSLLGDKNGNGSFRFPPVSLASCWRYSRGTNSSNKTSVVLVLGSVLLAVAGKGADADTGRDLNSI